MSRSIGIKICIMPSSLKTRFVISSYYNPSLPSVLVLCPLALVVVQLITDSRHSPPPFKTQSKSTKRTNGRSSAKKSASRLRRVSSMPKNTLVSALRPSLKRPPSALSSRYGVAGSCVGSLMHLRLSTFLFRLFFFGFSYGSCFRHGRWERDGSRT